MDTKLIQESIGTGFQSLKELHFTFSNPAFWFVLFLLFLVLSGPWSRKKALSFCAILATILLVMTHLEALSAPLAHATFNPVFFIRTFTACIIVIASAYYTSIR